MLSKEYVESLIRRLNGASIRLCGGYYEPKNEQEGADGALLMEAEGAVKAWSEAMVTSRERLDILWKGMQTNYWMAVHPIKKTFMVFDVEEGSLHAGQIMLGHKPLFESSTTDMGGAINEYVAWTVQQRIIGENNEQDTTN